MLEFSTPEAATAHVLANRNDTAAVVYAGRKYGEYSFRRILVSLGYDGASAAGLLPEYRAVVLTTMYGPGHINRNCWSWITPKRATDDDMRPEQPTQEPTLAGQ